MSGSYKWFLAQLKPNGFDRAVINLERQEIKSFMPLRHVQVRRGNRSTLKPQPLFPGYLFVNVDSESSQWRAINSTYGVSKLVSFGAQGPAPLPDQFISGLIARCDEENNLLPPDDLEIGEKVKIISGPFSDFIVTVETIPSQTRIGILFELLNQVTNATIDVDQIERIKTQD